MRSINRRQFVRVSLATGALASLFPAPAIQAGTGANEKINIITRCVPEEILMDDGKVSGLAVRNVDTGERTEIPCRGIFPYIGATATTNFLEGLGVTDSRGYIIVDKNMETSVKGLYGAGDVTVKDLRQVVTAVNDGAIAANSAARYLETIN